MILLAAGLLLLGLGSALWGVFNLARTPGKGLAAIIVAVMLVGGGVGVLHTMGL